MERELVRAILRKESPIAIVGDDAEARLDLIDSVSSLLIEGGARVIRVSSPDGSPLDLTSVMGQVLGKDKTRNPAERVERFFEVVALPKGDENKIVFFIDDAHLLAADTISYLGLLGTTTAGQPVGLQIVIAGDNGLIEQLPTSGGFASERIATRIQVGDPTIARRPSKAVPPPEPDPEPDPIPEPPRRPVIVTAPVRSAYEEPDDDWIPPPMRVPARGFGHATVVQEAELEPLTRSRGTFGKSRPVREIDLSPPMPDRHDEFRRTLAHKGIAHRRRVVLLKRTATVVVLLAAVFAGVRYLHLVPTSWANGLMADLSSRVWALVEPYTRSTPAPPPPPAAPTQEGLAAMSGLVQRGVGDAHQIGVADGHGQRGVFDQVQVLAGQRRDGHFQGLRQDHMA